MKKKALSLLLALVMVLSLMPTAAFAAETADTQPVESGVIADVQTDAITESGVERLLEEGKIEGSLTQKPMLASTDSYYTDLLDAGAALRKKMVSRSGNFSIPVRVSKKDVTTQEEMNAVAVVILSLGTMHTGVPNEGDYLLWGIEEMDFGGTYSETSKYYYLDIRYRINYMTSSSQESSVTSSVNAIMAGFNFTENTDDYGKALAIYDYICSHVKIGGDEPGTTSDIYKYTAYGALRGEAQALGYATLLYRLMLEAGIDCRVIAGYDAETDAEHNWNIVGLDGAYYNVDATWDAGYIDYGYFLKGSNNFTDHIREAVFDSEEFHTLHPTAKEDYVPADPAIIASGSCGENAAYTIYSDGYMEITGTGAMTNWASADEVPWKDVRSYVRYVSVADGITSVGSYAFANCKHVIFIDLPDSITEIGDYAFSNARMLTFVVPTGLKKIGQSAFALARRLEVLVIQDLVGWLSLETAEALTADTWYLGEEELKEVVIPEGVTAIRDYAFYGSDITSVHVPDSVTAIGKQAFYNVATLVNVTGCNKVSEIGESAFYRTSLTEISLNGITKIGASAFGGCNQLKKVTLGPGLTTVEIMAFSGSLYAIDLHISDVAAWCNVDFKSKESNPMWRGHAKVYVDGQLVTDLVIPTSVEKVKPFAFCGADITSVVLSEGVTELGAYCFDNVPLTDLAIPSTLCAIDDFGTAPQIKNLYISDVVAWCAVEREGYIGATVLCMNGEPVTEFVIPEGITTIEPYAFSQVSNEMTVTLPNTLTTIGNYAFAGTSFEQVTIPDSVTTLGAGAYEGSKMQKLVIGDGITIIDGAFANCQKLTDVTFGDNVELITNGAFKFCTKLESVVFPQSLRDIGYEAFYSCSKLVNVQFPDTLYDLANNAFENCESLKTLTFKKLLNLGNSSFVGCRNLRDIYFESDAPNFGADPVFQLLPTMNFHYPCNNETWTEVVQTTYKNIVWKPVHGESSEVSRTEPTCKTEGQVVYGCQLCGVGETEILPKLPHTEVIDAAVPATCSATGLTEGKHCSVCGEVLVAQTVTGKLPHTPVDGICSVCGEETVFFTQQPQSVTVKSGKTAKVTVAAEGEGLTYAWYWAPAGSDDFQLTTSFKGTSYSITMNESRDGRQVFCRVTDKFGSFVDSDIVTLSMAKPPVITRELTYGYAKKGEEIVVDFEATGNGELTYTWYYANAGSSTYKKTTSFTGPEYSVEMSDSRAGRKVYCVVTDAFGLSTKTKTATLRMELEIVNDLVDAKAVSGKKASVTVKANGQGLKYEWYYSDGGAFKKTTSFTGPTYSLTMNEARDGRQVYCKITDKYGNSVQTATATLTMVPPPQIVVEPTYAYAKKGEEAVVSFEAAGTGELTYEWYWAKAGSSTYKKTTSFTGPEYKVEMDDSRAGRKVYCVVTDETGASVKTKTVTLRMALEITEDLADVTVASGKKASVTVKANGQGLKYEWFYADNGGEFKLTTSFKTATYSITMNEARAGRQVFCRITDKYGNTVETAKVTLGMN